MEGGQCRRRKQIVGLGIPRLHSFIRLNVMALAAALRPAGAPDQRAARNGSMRRHAPRPSMG